MTSMPRSIGQRFVERWHAASDFRRAAFVACFCAVLFVLINWRNYGVDTISQALLPVRLLRDHTFNLDVYRDYYEELKDKGKGYSFAASPDGHLYPKNSIFVSLLATPLYLPPVLAGVPTENVRVWIAWSRVCCGLWTGVAMGLCYLSLRRWGSPRSALVMTLLLAFGTAIWTTVAQTIYDHLGAVVCTSALVFVLRDFPLRPGRAALAGFLLGAAVGMRLTAVVLLLPLGAYLYFWPGVLGGWRARLTATAGLLVVPLAAAFANAQFFGHWHQTGYPDQDIDRWTTPLWQGAIGQLLAPNAGLFVQSPFTILALVGGWAACRGPNVRDRGFLCALSLCFVAYWLFYARWYGWDGGLVPSTRLLCDGYPLWIPLVLVGWNAVRHQPRAAAVVAVLGVWSVAYHVVGVALFDAITDLNAPSSPWRPADHYVALHVGRYGLPATLGTIALTAVEFVVAAAVTAYVLAPFFLPRGAPAAADGPVAAPEPVVVPDLASRER
jgi:hypothetical protein